MNIDDIIKITSGIIVKKGRKKELNKIKIDSRKIKKDDIFITINTGYKYIDDAIKNGAKAIITDKNIKTDKNIYIIKVNDTLETLYKLAKYIRTKYDPIVIGITGSVGKTTMKDMIYELLKDNYNVVKNEGNENNYIGVPKTLLKIDEKTDIVITEIGMNHEGEIKYLSELIKPDIAVITNIGTSHIGNLGSKENIYKEKMNIVSGMESGILILNQEDKYLKNIPYIENINKYQIGIKKESDIPVNKLKENKATISIDDKQYEIKYISKPYLINSLQSLKIAHLFGVDINEAIKKLNNFKTTNNRLEKIIKNETIIYSDCYNASLESFINVLDIIKSEEKNKILILGDILELGKFSKQIHKKIGRKIKKIKNCILILIGKQVEYIKQYNKTRSIWLSSNEEIKECLSILDLENKIILIKGSHGMHLEEISDYLRQ